VLAQQPDGLVGENECVERAARRLGRQRRVRRVPDERDGHVREALSAHRLQIEARGMDHHRRVDAVPGTRFGEELLAAAAFLCGRPEVPNRAR
jgi:hypothetical protein